MYNQEKYQPQSDKVSGQSYQSCRDVHWEYGRKKDSIRRIATWENRTKGSTESNGSPDTFFLIRMFERILWESLYACLIHHPYPDTRKNQCYRKKDEKTSRDILPKRWINLYENCGGLEKDSKEKQWNNERSNNYVRTFFALPCKSSSEDNWQ